MKLCQGHGAQHATSCIGCYGSRVGADGVRAARWWHPGRHCVFPLRARMPGAHTLGNTVPVPTPKALADSSLAALTAPRRCAFGDREIDWRIGIDIGDTFADFVGESHRATVVPQIWLVRKGV